MRPLSALLVMAVSAAAPQGRPPSARGQERLIKEVRHELVMLPYYGVFDRASEVARAFIGFISRSRAR